VGIDDYQRVNEGNLWFAREVRNVVLEQYDDRVVVERADIPALIALLQKALGE